jgi:hypothetical protein
MAQSSSCSSLDLLDLGLNASRGSQELAAEPLVGLAKKEWSVVGVLVTDDDEELLRLVAGRVGDLVGDRGGIAKDLVKRL